MLSKVLFVTISRLAQRDCVSYAQGSAKNTALAGVFAEGCDNTALAGVFDGRRDSGLSGKDGILSKRIGQFQSQTQG